MAVALSATTMRKKRQNVNGSLSLARQTLRQLTPAEMGGVDGAAYPSRSEPMCSTIQDSHCNSGECYTKHVDCF